MEKQDRTVPSGVQFSLRHNIGSLTSFLEDNADVRARFLAQFTKPEFRVKTPLLAPHRTKDHSLAGTAFDYLLRFYIQKLNPAAKTGDWVPEAALDDLCASSDAATCKKATMLFEQAKQRHRQFLRSSQRRPPRDLIESSVDLANLDVIFRAGIVDPRIFKRPRKALVDDLECMLALVRPRFFRAEKRCILNPTFGTASELVAGADADLMVDNMLIDVKTSKHLRFDREIFNQVIGYYVLSCIGGVCNWRRAKIKHLAVYYARYGLLHRIPVANCLTGGSMLTFLGWFRRRARLDY